MRGQPIVRRPTKAIARRPTATSRGSTCASSEQCSRPPAPARRLSAWPSNRTTGAPRANAWSPFRSPSLAASRSCKRSCTRWMVPPMEGGQRCGPRRHGAVRHPGYEAAPASYRARQRRARQRDRARGVGACWVHCRLGLPSRGAGGMPIDLVRAKPSTLSDPGYLLAWTQPTDERNRH
jgi:hypothetical protein